MESQKPLLGKILFTQVEIIQTTEDMELMMDIAALVKVSVKPFWNMKLSNVHSKLEIKYKDPKVRKTYLSHTWRFFAHWMKCLLSALSIAVSLFMR